MLVHGRTLQHGQWCATVLTADRLTFNRHADNTLAQSAVPKLGFFILDSQMEHVLLLCMSVNVFSFCDFSFVLCIPRHDLPCVLQTDQLMSAQF